MNPTEDTDDAAHDDRLTERARAIAARFPQKHEISDCIQTVRMVGGLFASILVPALEDELSSEELVPSPEDALRRYTVVDAEKISKKLRALAKNSGVTPVLSTLELLQRLRPELRALLDDGCSYDEVNEALTEVGIDVRSLAGSLARRR